MDINTKIISRIQNEIPFILQGQLHRLYYTHEKNINYLILELEKQKNKY